MDMTIRAIALDLDGTLLDSRKRVSSRNLRAVLACRDRGIAVVIATARPPRSVRVLLPAELLGAGPLVCYNGAYAADSSGRVLLTRTLTPSAVARIVRDIAAAEPERLITFESADRMYANRTLTEAEQLLLGIPPGDAGLPEPLPFEQLPALPVTKLLLGDLPDAERRLAPYADEASVVVTDGGRLVQVMAPGVGKQHGVAAALTPHGIPPEAVMAFGDDANDAGLLAWCGHPVAMGNAIEPLKRLAREVAPTNDEDGVGAVLERLLGQLATEGSA